jgi:hypothetical protein
MDTEITPGENLLKVSKANLQKGLETVGGHLHLTNKRLIFVAHKFNIQTGVTEIELADVISVHKCWTKLLGKIPIFPNSIRVIVKQGKEFFIVLNNRDSWISSIKNNIENI